MDATSLGQRIATFEDGFRVLVETGLFDKEQVVPERAPPRSSTPPLVSLVLWRAYASFLGQPHRVPLPHADQPPVTPATRAEQIAASIRHARELLKADQLPAAAEELTQGEIVLRRELSSRSVLWRYCRLHQAHLFAYYGFWLVLLGLAASRADIREATVWGVPVFVLALGCLGSVLRGLYWMQYQVARRIFRIQFVLAHFSVPLLGMILGLGSFLLLKAGLVGLGHGVAGPPDEEPLIRLFAFLAGFNWIWLMDKLGQVGSRKANQAASESQPGRPA